MIVKRKAAATLRVQAHGRSSHSGSAPQQGRSALLALAAVAQRVAARSDPAGPDRLTAVPTILRSGEAFNVVPPTGALVCDLRADQLEAFEPVLAAVPERADEVRIESTLVRAWPGMDTRAATARRARGRSERLGRPLVASERGGASDASHIAAGGIELTVDGLGPRGGGAHTPGRVGQRRIAAHARRGRPGGGCGDPRRARRRLRPRSALLALAERARQGVARLDVELAVDAPEVRLDGLLRDEQ